MVDSLSLLDSVGMDEKEFEKIIADLTPEQLEVFLKGLDEMFATGASETEHKLIDTDFIERPVDMETFLRDPYYLGIIDQVFPKIVDDLLEVFDPSSQIFLVILGGSVGWGKSTFARIIMARIIYEISCFRSPQKAYGMMESDKMFFANVSVTHTQAKRVMFEGLKGIIKGSEYFRKTFPYEDLATELRFPNNVLVAAATQTQVLGMNTFSAVMDEANFMTLTEGTKMAKIKGKRIYDQAEIVFAALYRRMETRFMRRGLLPGKLVALSSAQYPDDFIERKSGLYANNPHALVRNYAVWDTLPQDRFLGPKFRIYFNRESGMGRISDEKDKGTEEEESIDVPIEYHHDFEIDMEGSIRDLAGRATAAIEPFIKRRDKILEMCDPERRHGYSLYETTLRDGGYLLKDVLCEWFEEKNENGIVTKSGWKPKVNPKKKRFIHIDPGLSGDAAGFCMGHISNFEERQRIRVIQLIDPITGIKKLVREPFRDVVAVIWLDLILRIVPPPNGEIILNDVRQLIYDLKQIGFRIGLVTIDSYQSKDTQQLLEEKGYQADELSVDTSPEPYNRLKMALYESRVRGYMHDTLVRELRGLERNKKKGKIDHRPGGCFTGETRVALLDGTLPTFEELGVRFRENEKFYVYTIGSNGVTVGEASNPRITMRDAEIVEVMLDNFQVVRCTPQHQFMLTDGSYVEAQNLNCDMRLMPLYRNRCQKGGWLDYEKYFDPFFRREKVRFQNHRGNHRVLSVKEGGCVDVWDITVKDTHNFALAAGVFVHNSKDVADSVAGVIYNCETRVLAEPMAPSLGVVESPVDDEAKRKQDELKWLLGDTRKEG